MSQANTEIVKLVFEAWNEGSLENVLPFIADVAWTPEGR